MAFNHYAKIKRILSNYDWNDWYILKINQPTKSKSFSGEIIHYDFYYRIIEAQTNKFIPYCKFQQISRLASILKIDISVLELKIKE